MLIADSCKLIADCPPKEPSIPESPEFALRRAERPDEDVIRRLVRDAQINPMGLDWRHFVVAIDDHERVIGCGQIKEHRGGARELASLVVAPEWRELGVAGAIMRWLMDETGPPLWLMCRSDLVSFYLRFGFREVGSEEPQPRYFRRMRALARAFLFAHRDEYLAIMAWQG